MLESVEFILKNNTFKFNYEYFLQLIGTATGTDMAPTYATLTMGYHELKFYTISEIHWGVEIREYIEQAWGCFLDDCEIPMDEEKVQPEELHAILNSIHPKIQFTMQQSKEMVPFLDGMIRKEDNRTYILRQLPLEDIYHFRLHIQSIVKLTFHFVWQDAFALL